LYILKGITVYGVCLISAFVKHLQCNICIVASAKVDLVQPFRKISWTFDQ